MRGRPCRRGFLLPSDERAARAALARTATRYRSAGRFTRHYVAGKLKRDPVGPALLALAAAEDFGVVVDVGCGRGQFGVALLEAGAARSVIGLECQAGHLGEAVRAAEGLAFEGRVHDLATMRGIPACDTVLMIDVLYQLGTAAQMALLQNAAGAARRLVVIRTADPEAGLRSFVTKALERGFRRVWPHAGAMVNARSVGEVVGVLEGLGFRCERVPCWAGTPFSNVLLVGRAGYRV